MLRADSNVTVGRLSGGRETESESEIYFYRNISQKYLHYFHQPSVNSSSFYIKVIVFINLVKAGLNFELHPS